MSLNSRVDMLPAGKVYCAHCIFTGKKYIGQNERKVRQDTSRKGLKGERNGRAILNWNKVEQIRQMHSSKKYKNQEIANIFGIKLGTLEKIVSNKLWTV